MLSSVCDWLECPQPIRTVEAAWSVPDQACCQGQIFGVVGVLPNSSSAATSSSNNLSNGLSSTDAAETTGVQMEFDGSLMGTR